MAGSGALPTSKNDQVRVNANDSGAGYLADKIKSSDSSVTISVGGCNCELDLSVDLSSVISIEQWRKYAFNFDDAEFATGTNSVVIEIESSEPTGSTILSTRKKQSLSWTGNAPLIGTFIEIGYNGTYDTAFRLSSSNIPPRGISESPLYESVSTGTMEVRFTFDGGVDTDLLQGGVDIWIKTAILE